MHTIRNRKLVASILVATSLLAVCATAVAMDVTGSVRAPDEYVAQTRRSATQEHAYYWEEWNGFLEPRPTRIDLAREIAVVLLGNAPEPTDHNVTVEWRGGALMPSTIVVRTGTILAIENHDDVIHELSGVGLNEVPSEATGSGSTRRTLALAHAGHAELVDALVPHAKGHLHVLANLVAVARPQANGLFTFTNVPAGQFVLKVFDGANEVGSRTVDVVEGHPLTVDTITLTAASR